MDNQNSFVYHAMGNFMKLFLFIFLFLGLNSCFKQEKKLDPTRFPNFSCKINGILFVSRGAFIGCNSQPFHYYPNGFLDAPADHLTMAGTNCVNGDNVGIRIFGFDTLHTDLNMNDTTHFDSISPFFSTYTEDEIYFSILDSGRISFDHFSDKQDETNGRVSGTFEFTVHNDELDTTVVITEGSFQYIINYQWY